MLRTNYGFNQRFYRRGFRSARFNKLETASNMIQIYKYKLYWHSLKRAFQWSEVKWSETLFKEETTSPLSDFHERPPYKNKLITTIIIKYSKYKN